MANKMVQNFTNFSLLFALNLALFLASAQELKETKMVLYMQDFATGPNATLIPVAGIAGQLWTFTQFGTHYVTDDPLTEGPELNSTAAGRAQGIYVTTGLDGRNLLVLLSFVFTNKEYNGSTIEVQGISKQFDAVRELSVVSGTGGFRFARGYATFQTYFADIPSGYTIIQCNLTVKHSYEHQLSS